MGPLERLIGSLYFFSFCFVPPRLNAKTLSDKALTCWPHLGPSLALSWFIFAPSRLILAPSWPTLAPSWPIMGPSWLMLAPSWLHLESSWPHLEPSWLHLGPSCLHLGTSWLHLVSVMPASWLHVDRFLQTYSLTLGCPIDLPLGENGAPKQKHVVIFP